MAVEQYFVCAGMQEFERGVGKKKSRKVRTGLGEKEKAKIEEAMLDAQYFICEAESTKEAIEAVGQVYPAQKNDKMLAVKLSSMTEE